MSISNADVQGIIDWLKAVRGLALHKAVAEVAAQTECPKVFREPETSYRVAITQFECLCAVVDGEVFCVCPEHERNRLAIADEIVRRVDTVTLLRVEEVEDVRRRALAGEFDDFEL